jgi:hypothetical protein
MAFSHVGHTGTELITKVKQCWPRIVLGGVTRENTPRRVLLENGVLARWTYWYPFHHRSEAILGPDAHGWVTT